MRAERTHSIVDWDGSGTVDAAEIQDMVLIAEVTDYVTAEEADDLDEFAVHLEEHMGGPFTSEQLIAEAERIDEEGT